MNAVIGHSMVESWWSSGCPMGLRQPEGGGLSQHKGHLNAAGGHCAGQPCSSSRIWPLLLGQQTFQQLHVHVSSRRGTGLPLQADWAGGVSSSTGTMTRAGHGEKSHILAFAITSD